MEEVFSSNKEKGELTSPVLLDMAKGITDALDTDPDASSEAISQAVGMNIALAALRRSRTPVQRLLYWALSLSRAPVIDPNDEDRAKAAKSVAMASRFGLLRKRATQTEAVETLVAKAAATERIAAKHSATVQKAGLLLIPVLLAIELLAAIVWLRFSGLLYGWPVWPLAALYGTLYLILCFGPIEFGAPRLDASTDVRKAVGSFFLLAGLPLGAWLVRSSERTPWHDLRLGAGAGVLSVYGIFATMAACNLLLVSPYQKHAEDWSLAWSFRGRVLMQMTEVAERFVASVKEPGYGSAVESLRKAERYLVRGLRLQAANEEGASAEAAWLKRRCAQISVYFDDLARALMLPGTLRRHEIMERLRDVAEAAALDDYSKILASEEETIARRKDDARSRARVVAVYAAPLATVLAVRAAGLVDDPALFRSLLLGASLLLAVRVLSIIDPGFFDSLKGLKDAVDSFKPKS